jgi:hypothetical protein
MNHHQTRGEKEAMINSWHDWERGGHAAGTVGAGNFGGPFVWLLHQEKWGKQGTVA